jgi:hypothetical protein
MPKYLGTDYTTFRREKDIRGGGVFICVHGIMGGRGF